MAAPAWVLQARSPRLIPARSLSAFWAIPGFSIVCRKNTDRPARIPPGCALHYPPSLGRGARGHCVRRAARLRHSKVSPFDAAHERPSCRGAARRGASRRTRGGAARSGKHATHTASRAAANWRQTLWAMVAIQFIMTMAFSVLTPIMPLLLPELGVQSEAGDQSVGRHPDRQHLVHRRLRVALVGQRRRPARPQTDAAALEPGDRGVHRADGDCRQCLAVLRVSRLDGRLRRVFLGGDRAGGEPGAGRAARLFPGLARRPGNWSAR